LCSSRILPLVNLYPRPPIFILMGKSYHNREVKCFMIYNIAIYTYVTNIYFCGSKIMARDTVAES
jgi:hypothetical protein